MHLDSTQRLRLYRTVLDAAACAMLSRPDALWIPPRLGLRDRSIGYPFHPTPELFFQVEGRKRFLCPTTEHEASEATITLIPSGIPHREFTYPAGEAFLDIISMFSSDGFSLHCGYAAPENRVRCGIVDFFPTPRSTKIQRYLREVAEAQWEGVSGANRLVPHLMRAALFWLSETLEDIPPQSKSPYSNRVAQALRIIEVDFSDPGLDVTSIAAVCGCVPDTLSRSFKREYRKPLIQVLNHRRISYAQDLILENKLTHAEIAWASGFSSPSYFNRVFRQICQQTPSEFRNGQTESRVRNSRLDPTR